MNKEKAENERRWITIKDIALVGMMTAIIEVCKRALDFVPNVELITFWVIMFTLFFGRKTLFAVYSFTLIEGFLYGMHTWWIMYLYIWPLLVLITRIFRKNTQALLWAVIAGIYGLLFGAFCSIPYIVIGAVDGGIRSGLYAGFTWWIAGIPWDIAHGIANFAIMLVLYHPVRRVMEYVKKQL